jgi:hypothetical protein
MDRVRFETYKGKQVLVIDYTGCPEEEVLSLAVRCREMVATQPKDSVLTLPILSGVRVRRDDLQRLKEIAVLNRPYVKRSAIVGDDSQKPLLDSLEAFSVRKFPIFKTREEALEWLVLESD